MAEQNTTSGPSAIEFYGGYPVYSESGVDLTQLRRNLYKSLEFRWNETAQASCWLRQVGVPMAKDDASPEQIAMFQPGPIIQLLIGHQVEFVVIGGMAMLAQGSSHMTKDLDICYNRTPGNIMSLETAFAGIHPYLRGAPPGLPFRFDATTIQTGLNFTLITDLGDVDLLGEVRGVGFFDRVHAQSEEKSGFGVTFRVLSIEGLIAAKKAAGRAKDRNHLLELEELKKLRDATRES